MEVWPLLITRAGEVIFRPQTPQEFGTPDDPCFWTQLAPEVVGVQLHPQKSFGVSKLHVCLVQTEGKERREDSLFLREAAPKRTS